MKSDELIKIFLQDKYYRVNSRGQVFSCYTRQGHLSSEWKELKQIDKKRYKYINYRHGQLAIHRLVAQSFIRKIPKNYQVNHKDGNPSNNDLSNLEIVSQAKNNLHRFRVLGWAPVIGNKKINHEIADAIREDALTLRLTNSQLRQKYGVSKATISYVLNNRIWK